MHSADGLRGKYSNVKSPASPLTGLLKARDQPVMRATGHGFARYPAVYAVWSLPGRRRIRAGMEAWGRKPQTIPAFLYAETATRKMRTRTIGWDERNSSGDTNWI
jgi:hypothetical protein